MAERTWGKGMALWDDALERHPGLRGVFGDLEGIVGEHQSTFGPVGPYADVLDVDQRNRYLEMARDPSTAPGGVYGYGLWYRGSSPVAAVFVQPGLAPFGGAPISTTPLASPELGRYRWPRRVLAVALPPPQLHSRRPAKPQAVVPNAHVLLGSQRAVLGVPVATARCPRGYTTAGHAAPATPVRVRASTGEEVGAVNLAVHLDNAPQGKPSPDIALVELAPSRPEEFSPLGMPLDAARETDKVSIMGADPPGTWIRGLSPSFALRPDIAAWGEVAITADAISMPGDSGSLVVRDDGAVVGHIVAGFPGVFSVVQDIEYCLAEFGAHIR